MPALRLTRRAEEDLRDVAEYTRRTWGDEQCARYLDQIERGCQRIAEHPMLGRASERIRPNLRRYEVGKHLIYYRRDGDGILVLRILHERMMPDLHVDDDTEP